MNEEILREHSCALLGKPASLSKREAVWSSSILQWLATPHMWGVAGRSFVSCVCL